MIRLTLREGVRFLSAASGSLIVTDQGRRLALHGIGGLEPAMRRLGKGAARLADLLAAAGAGPGDYVYWQARVFRVLGALVERRLIEVHCLADRRVLLTAIPTGPLSFIDFGMAVSDDRHAAGAEHEPRFRLSRFACAHWVDGRLAVECPQQSLRLLASGPETGAIIAALAQPTSAAEVSLQVPAMAATAAAQCVRFLAACGAAGQADQDGLLTEDTDAQLRQREYHDVLMHMQSRWGLTDARIGGAYPFASVVEPSPAIRPAPPGPLIGLAVPDLDAIIAHDPPLARVMENRRSLRQHDGLPLTATQLGEFLYRVARVRWLHPVDGRDPQQYEITNRTYPSGGAAYDLELYLAVRSCAGIAPGLYHYQPADHALAAVACQAAQVRRLLQVAYLSNGGKVNPHVLIVITSRFSRLSWKYRGISYATTLRNVGVLYEAMYLAATAMNLAPCALGCGDSGLFGAMTSLNPLIESSVGEFMLGTQPASRQSGLARPGVENTANEHR